MSTFKNLVGWLALFWAFATSNAQQVLKKVIQNTNSTTLELLTLANGSTSSNVIWPNWFDVGISSWEWTVILYNPSTWQVLSPNNSTNLTPPSIPNEQVWNWTFQSIYNTKNIKYNYQDSWSTESLNIETIEENSNRDEISDWNNNIDMLHTKIILPNTLANWNPVPNWFIAIINSRDWVAMGSWGGDTSSKRLWFQFNSSTWWTAISNDPNWNPFDVLEEVTLWTNEFDYKKNEEKAYPNPTKWLISVSDWDWFDEDFEYEIFDITGRKVLSGKWREWQPIDINQLNNGNYILNTKKEDSFSSNKIIKN